MFALVKLYKKGANSALSAIMFLHFLSSYMYLGKIPIAAILSSAHSATKLPTILSAAFVETKHWQLKKLYFLYCYQGSVTNSHILSISSSLFLVTVKRDSTCPSLAGS